MVSEKLELGKEAVQHVSWGREEGNAGRRRGRNYNLGEGRRSGRRRRRRRHAGDKGVATGTGMRSLINGEQEQETRKEEQEEKEGMFIRRGKE